MVMQSFQDCLKVVVAARLLLSFQTSLETGKILLSWLTAVAAALSFSCKGSKQSNDKVAHESRQQRAAAHKRAIILVDASCYPPSKERGLVLHSGKLDNRFLMS